MTGAGGRRRPGWLHHPKRGHGLRGVQGTPQMQHAGMLVDVNGGRRVELNHTIFRLPKQIFDCAHERPAWRLVALVHADADVLPALAIARHTLYACAFDADAKESLEAVVVAAQLASADAIAV